MKTKFFSIVITCFIVTTVFSQSNLNNYKYIIVPNKFDFLKQKDQYQLNSLTKFLFNKYGFEALVEGQNYPEDLVRNRCLALRSNVIKGSGLFKTKLNVVLKDCNDKVVYTSGAGESREKEYKTAYNLAIRAAFKSIEALNYKYKPTESITSLGTPKVNPVKSEVAEEIQQLREEIQSLKKEKEAVVSKEEEASVVVKQEPETVVEESMKAEKKVLYAQEIENGFQLVDSSPKVIYKIKSTQLKEVYLVENKSAIIYKKGDDWVIEYYTDNVVRQFVLNIKF
ncbi:hypothetical protein A8C32_09020 [Flavivirga aquatica]|uniref:Uncharacterized protein n=1 Tax=Flavivirga aquatica TaxID=1849968 RepID=A0A1E5SJZ9_9FLAO|nr:hypothetical protein [Flavivirga aquatica]OEJ99440.1 hypothetical protein A8C32_09020 [Flavivirga aquatica]